MKLNSMWKGIHHDKVEYILGIKNSMIFKKKHVFYHINREVQKIYNLDMIDAEIIWYNLPYIHD